ncbi:MAG TPA: DNA polymerase ligase N-terminal domain-containing protein [Thermoguttaceae bacterium]|nr:DNA polymerase ligase N-terminal domain-containing protein [Thermoguttaceae bacterium]
MPRFVILEHDAPRGRHWDFLLETGPVLTCWALASVPDTPGPIEAESLADHRIEYLDYEGPVSGDRGTVTRWDAGTYQFVRQTAREIIVALAGSRLHGTATLGRAEEDTRQWRFEMSHVGQAVPDGTTI